MGGYQKNLMAQLWILRSPTTASPSPPRPRPPPLSEEPGSCSVAQLKAESLMNREVENVALSIRLRPGTQVVAWKGWGKCFKS